MPGGGALPATLRTVVLPVALLGLWASVFLAVGLWVFRDARDRGTRRAAGLALASVVVPFVLPYYLYRRSRSAGESRSDPPAPVDRGLATWGAAGLAAIAVGAVFAPPDPFSQAIYALGSLVPVLPVAYLLVYRGWYRNLL